MMHKVLGLLFFCLVTKAHAQYYYNDILGNKQARDNYLLLKKNNIKKVTVTSSDPDGTPTEGFAILQEINASKNEMTTSTKSSMNPISILRTTYLSNNYPSATKDSTEASVSLTTYTYSDKNESNLSVIFSSTHEPEKSAIKFSEERHYSFEGTLPKSMWRIKNGKDSLQVLFFTEEHGRIGEERWMQKGKLIETYYYYYDTNNHLTDIVRYNAKAKRLLPEYTFEYDELGRIMGMNAFISGTNQYRTWRYTYDDRGLKEKEVIFNKYKQIEGKIIYNYEYVTTF